MSRFLTLLKVGAVLFITVLLLVPMGQIRELIRERQALRDQVLKDVARSAANAQLITGPVIVVPYTRTVHEQQLDARNHAVIRREIAGELRLLPQTMDLDGTLGTQERRRGIYKARVFQADARLSGRFEIPAHYGIEDDPASYRFGAPHLVLGISDIRGIGRALTLTANGSSIAFEPGTGTDLFASGVHAPLDLDASTTAQPLAYEIALTLSGTGEFSITPVGRDSHVRLVSDWPHPSFTGEYLPSTREITGAGFKADWQTSFFATDMAEALRRCVPAAGDKDGTCAALRDRHFGVSFIDPVDQYLKSERAAKYAFLFIGLTFAGFCIMEVLRRVRVHPVQYGLVGLSLAMFFLLLLSFSEHIGFTAAYAVSAVACVGLIAFYVSHVLGSRTQGAAFGVGLASLYGLLYGILSSEDYALLMGSLLVFGVLAAVMVVTRRVSWSGAG